METYPEQGMIAQGMIAKMPRPPRPIDEMFGHLNEALSSLEKTIVSFGDQLSPAMRDSVPEPTSEDPKYPGLDSRLGRQLQEFCLRIDAAERTLNEYRNRCEI